MKIEFPSSSSLTSLFIYTYIYSRKRISFSDVRIQQRVISPSNAVGSWSVDTRFFTFAIGSARVDGPPMNAIRSRRSSKNANDTRRINERHRCRGSSRRSLIGRRGITRRNNARGVCQFRKTNSSRRGFVKILSNNLFLPIPSMEKFRSTFSTINHLSFTSKWSILTRTRTKSYDFKRYW